MCIPSYKGLLILVFVSFGINMYAGEGLIELSHAVLYLNISCMSGEWLHTSIELWVVGSFRKASKSV